jgi:hypothetical protein
VGYIETSALTGMNVEECFIKLARAVIETIDNGACCARPQLALFFQFSRVLPVVFCEIEFGIACIFFTIFLLFTMCVKHGKTRSGELDLNAIGAIGSSAAAGGSSSSDGGLTVKTAGGAEATNVFGSADGAAGPSGSCSSC